jgi:hypothetical protein
VWRWSLSPEDLEKLAGAVVAESLTMKDARKKAPYGVIVVPALMATLSYI